MHKFSFIFRAPSNPGHQAQQNKKDPLKCYEVEPWYQWLSSPNKPSRSSSQQNANDPLMMHGKAQWKPEKKHHIVCGLLANRWEISLSVWKQPPAWLWAPSKCVSVWVCQDQKGWKDAANQTRVFTLKSDGETKSEVEEDFLHIDPLYHDWCVSLWWLSEF